MVNYILIMLHIYCDYFLLHTRIFFNSIYMDVMIASVHVVHVVRLAYLVV